MSDIGDLIEGRYRVERSVGSGGMGIVYLATDLLANRRVAVKVMGASIDPSVAARARLEREIELLSRVDSPHVAKFLAAGYLDDGLPYYVMEFLEGRDLKAELRYRGPLPYREAAAYIAQACRGIAVAHRLGIVHRDLKPHNLFLTGLDGVRTVKIVDFGVAKSLGATDPGLTATNASVGTPLYMSPEQLIDAQEISTKADVWALGVILYELLAGFSPFSDSSPGAVIAAVTLDDPVPIQKVRRDIPVEIAKAIDLALRKLPRDRIDSAEELEQLLLHHATPDRLLIVPADVDMQTRSAVERPPRTRVSAYLRDQILAAIDADAPQERVTLRCLPTASTETSRPLPERLSLIPALQSLRPELHELMGRVSEGSPARSADAQQRRFSNATRRSLKLLALVLMVPTSMLAYRQHSRRVTGPSPAISPSTATQPLSSVVLPNTPYAQVDSMIVGTQAKDGARSVAPETATVETMRVGVFASEGPPKKARNTLRVASEAMSKAAGTAATAQTSPTRIVPKHL